MAYYDYDDYDYDYNVRDDYESNSGCGEGYSCYNCPNLGCPANERN